MLIVCLCVCVVCVCVSQVLFFTHETIFYSFDNNYIAERAFLIEWLDPPGLSDYLEPKTFDWANLNSISALKSRRTHDIGSWKASQQGISSQWYMNTNFTEYFTLPVEIVQGHRYDFMYAIVRNPSLMPKAYELGVDRIKCFICCAFDLLFKMSGKFEGEMSQLLQELGHPKRPLLTVQLRAKSKDMQQAVQQAELYMSCANAAIADLKLDKEAVIQVPVFNNRLLVHLLAKKYVSELKTPVNVDPATKTIHTHLGSLPAGTSLEVAKGVQERTFKELFLVMNSTIIVRTKGYMASFGNIADAIRRHYNEPGTVYTYNVGNKCTLFPDGSKIE